MFSGNKINQTKLKSYVLYKNSTEQHATWTATVIGKEHDWNILKDTEKKFSFFKELALYLIYIVDYLG